MVDVDSEIEMIFCDEVRRKQIKSLCAKVREEERERLGTLMRFIQTQIAPCPSPERLRGEMITICDEHNLATVPMCPDCNAALKRLNWEMYIALMRAEPEDAKFTRDLRWIKTELELISLRLSGKQYPCTGITRLGNFFGRSRA